AAHTQWKEFMCQNLGATAGINPFSPEAGNHGAKYQWGYNPANSNVSDNRYLTQTNDQQYTGTPPAGWSNTTMPDGSWSDTNKTANDPCPSGYRVPTSAVWQAVVANNNVERVGSWADNGNYTSALYFRNPSNVRTLMLPLAGYRYYADGTLLNRGSNGVYWSSSVSTSLAYYLDFISSSVYVNSSARTYGFSVRCVAE
ncbi:fibrobacter succinogenes major paralogous domain-containing protein, partial [Elizabethkingia ursingii]|uniref:fibrobacter succinogenes major paralogous domain-containing protein n=1 Tax=Elizabethkingia ursingii TaxID=1756150 RepID=UPI000B027B76